jgi:hypothetical protein
MEFLKIKEFNVLYKNVVVKIIKIDLQKNRLCSLLSLKNKIK